MAKLNGPSFDSITTHSPGGSPPPGACATNPNDSSIAIIDNETIVYLLSRSSRRRLIVRSRRSSSPIRSCQLRWLDARVLSRNPPVFRPGVVGPAAEPALPAISAHLPRPRCPGARPMNVERLPGGVSSGKFGRRVQAVGDPFPDDDKAAHGGNRSGVAARARPGFRRPVRAAHRAAGAGAARVRADRPARHHGGAGPRAQPAGLDPLGRAEERVRAGGAALRPGASSRSACRSWASATGCSSPPRRWGPGPGQPGPRRVRPDRVPGARPPRTRSSTTSRARRSSG